LLTQSGELLSMRQHVEARELEAATLQDMVSSWRKDWRQVEQGISALLRRSAPGPREILNGTSTIDGKLELAVSRNRDALGRFERSLQRLLVDLRTDRRAAEQTAGALDAEVRRARMLPFAQACEGLDRLACDLTRQGDKKVEILIEGSDIELDRSVLEGLKDPLLHLVRNAVDHGIEPAIARSAAGKPSKGRVTVAATLRGSRVEIAVTDDGKGLDLAAIRGQLRKRDLVVPEHDRELAECVFLQGVSTSPTVTRLSGRGVGLDVVKTTLASMRGTVDVSFEAGRGTRFTLSVPLTLTSLRAVLLGAGGQVFAVDSMSVRKALRIGMDDIRSIEGREVLLIEGQPVPIVALLESLGGSARPPIAEAGKVPVVVLAAGNRLAAFVVDALPGEREIMIRTLGPRLRSIKCVTGGTVLADGKIALILDSTDLVGRALNLRHLSHLAQGMSAAPQATKKHLLVVDDSVTIRTWEKSILEGAGYEVTLAADGAEAWQLLLEKGADLVVSDVEMPRMDGFSLTEAIRRSKRFRDVPVILVTAMESDTDKARGLAAGADAYQLKSAFDQEDLIATIQQIL
jgi:two-component system chemotaxis sensor kinase CheA